jgi:hypothetical protein
LTALDPARFPATGAIGESIGRNAAEEFVEQFNREGTPNGPSVRPCADFVSFVVSLGEDLCDATGLDGLVVFRVPVGGTRSPAR